MMNKRILIMGTALHMLISPALAADEDLSGKLETAIQKLEAATALVEAYRTEIKALEERVQTLEQDEQSELPEAAVIAFASECPDGWIRFEEAASRFIVGASTTAELEVGPAAFRDGSNGDALEERPLLVQNGTEFVRLTISQMPTHTHGVRQAADKLIDSPGLTANEKIGVTQPQHFGPVQSSSSGEGLPHYNMPPYIALYYCKKEAG